MRSFLLLLFGFTSLLLSSQSRAQISNFVVNGSSTNFTMASGDTIIWSYDIATGGTAIADIWYDVNQNGLIEPGTDRRFASFTQTDGETSGDGGPPDMDGLVDGHVFFSFKIGLAPGKYVLRFSHNGVPSVITGTVTPLASPAHTISGHVTPPPGKSAAYIIVEMSTSEDGLNTFWDAVTDSLGNYSIQMDADTSGNPRKIRIQENPYPPSIISPEETTLVVTGNHAGYDITFIAAAAQVAGYLLDSDGAPISSTGAFLSRSDSAGYISRRAFPNSSGFFQIGLLPGDLSTGGWWLQSETHGPDNITTTEMQGSIQIGTINPGDSLFRNLYVFPTNSTIRGTVLLNGATPGYPLQITATSLDTAVATVYSDSMDGSFTIPVSDKLHSYNLGLNWSSYGWIVDPLTAHAGDTNLVLNIHSTTSADVDHQQGWNMLSVPLVMSNTRKADLFPSATTPAFTYVAGSGYKTDSILQNGKGYWMKFIDSSLNTMSGSLFSRETINVLAGWNMIAPPTYGISTGAIVYVGTTPTTSYYGYSGSYFQATYLSGGKGYWIKLNSPGQLILNASVIAPTHQSDQRPTPEPGPDEADEIRQLTFTDASGEARSVYFSNRAAKRDLSWYALPPVPPGGVMDVRFASHQRVEFGAGRAEELIPVAISSAIYPVKISLGGAAGDRPVQLKIDAQEVVLDGSRVLSLETERSSVALILSGSPKQSHPVAFALRQNYPNPFNPSTLISYDIAEPARVRLVIFNTLGEEVARPVDEFRQAGKYEHRFSSPELPSGVYFYRLTAGTYTAIRKMILMK